METVVAQQYVEIDAVVRDANGNIKDHEHTKVPVTDALASIILGKMPVSNTKKKKERSEQ